MNKFYLWVALLLLAGPVSAQLTPFTPYVPEAKSLTGDERKIQPYKAHFSQLGDAKALSDLLATADEGRVSGKTVGVEVSIPDPNGELVTFKVYRYQMITPELQALYPNFVTLHGYDVTDVTRRVRMDWTSKGFGAAVTGGREGRWHMDPLYAGSTEAYQSYYSSEERGRPAYQAVCGFEADDKLVEEMMSTYSGKAVGDCNFREYRLALACTGEYYQAVDDGNGQADVIAEMMRAINRVNEVYERDLALRTNIINLPNSGGTVQLVYSDGATDPYTNNNGSLMLDENQATVDAVVGDANYDIGHVFSTGGGGIAQLNSPCVSDEKAMGVTGLPNPTGEGFYIDFVAHEMGHQFGGTHTFNSPGTPGDNNDACANRSAFTAFEPGGGTTIQAYAGICGSDDNIQANSDPYYHAGSIQQIAAYMEATSNGIGPVRGGDCATITSTANNEPSISQPTAATQFTIPAGTPFYLDAAASDPDGDAVTYCWEQFDSGSPIVGVPTGFESGEPALFRSFSPTATARRYFPTLESVVTGTNSEWEVLPQTARDMTFIVTVRDFGAAGYGCLVQEEATVSVVETGAQFDVLVPNGGEEYLAGSQQTFTWDVAGTDAAAGVNCQMVTLMLSTDGGLTFDQDLGTFANTGSAQVTLPNVTEVDVRLMVRCATSIFYEVSDADFTIAQTDFALAAAETTASTCTGTPTYTVTANALQGYTGTVNYSFDNLPGSVTAAAAPTSSTFTAGGATEETVTVTLMNANQLTNGNYTFDLVGTDNSGTIKRLELTLEVAGDFTLFTPTDGQVFAEPDANGDATFPLSFDPATNNPDSYQAVVGGNQIINIPSATGPNSQYPSIPVSGVVPGATFEVFVRTVGGTGAVQQTCPVTIQFGQPSGTTLSSVGTSPIEGCEGRDLKDEFRILFEDGDLTGPVTLTVASSPMGLTPNIATPMLSDGQSTVVSFDGEETLTAGNYTIVITATDGANNTEDIELVIGLEEDGVNVVQPANPDAFIEAVMVNGCASTNGMAIFVDYDWDPVPNATGYTLNVMLGNANFPAESTDANTTEVNGQGYCVETGDVLTYTVTADLPGGATAVSCGRTITVGEDPALPVTWLSFTARPVGKVSQLNWRVNQDQAHAGFQVQRSMDGVQNWQDLAWVERLPADGEAGYGYTDLEVANGTYYYRLRQEDNDGRRSYSTIEAVTFADGRALVVYPNPVSNLLQIRLGEVAGAEKLEYQLVNNLGQLVRNGRLQDGRATVDVAELPTAVYQLLVSDAEGIVASQRVVVK